MRNKRRGLRFAKWSLAEQIAREAQRNVWLFSAADQRHALQHNTQHVRRFRQGTGRDLRIRKRSISPPSSRPGTAVQANGFSRLTYEPIGIALPAGDAQFINWTENFLDRMDGSNGIEELGQRWFGLKTFNP